MVAGDQRKNGSADQADRFPGEDFIEHASTAGFLILPSLPSEFNHATPFSRIDYAPPGGSSDNPSAFRASWHWSSPGRMATQTFGRVG